MSHVHELLLAYHLLTVGEDTLQKHLQSYLLNKLQGGLYGSTMHSLFTHEMYRAVEGGDALTHDRIAEIYTGLLFEFRAPVEIDSWAQRGWLVGSHARLPYHYYQYALGVTGALWIVEKLLNGELTPEEYHEFLRVGGTMCSVDAFEALGLDIRSQELFRWACSAVQEHVEELDTLDLCRRSRLHLPLDRSRLRDRGPHGIKR